MKKISTLFVFDYIEQKITEKVRDEHAWVLDGEGIATIKKDGTSCAIIGGQLYKRFDRKLNDRAQKTMLSKRSKNEDFWVDEGCFRTLPDGAIACVNTYDPVTYHWPYWVPAIETEVHYWEAFSRVKMEGLCDGTYELVGPKVGKNLYNLSEHYLWKHGEEVVDVDRTFSAIKEYIISTNEEGLVFHHSDGRMCKIRRSDFSIDRSRKWCWRDAKRDEFHF